MHFQRQRKFRFPRLANRFCEQRIAEPSSAVVWADNQVMDMHALRFSREDRIRNRRLLLPNHTASLPFLRQITQKVFGSPAFPWHVGA